jgi:hypothetical protein
MRRWFQHAYLSVWNRNGASTLEYIAVIAGAALLASLLYFALTNTDTQQTIQTKIITLIYGEETQKNEPSNNQQITNEVANSNESTQAEDEPGFINRSMDYLSRKGGYLLEVGEDLWDYTVDSVSEEFDYATEDFIGWFFWDDWKSAWNGEDARTGEELSWLERGDRVISGIPVGPVGKTWKYGGTGIRGLIKAGKKAPDVLKGLACAKKKGKDCKDSSKSPGKKTSVTFGQPIEIVYQGKKGKLRVDAEPDGNKVQIQMGKGKKSEIDERINPDEPIEPQIPKYIKKAIGKGKMPELIRNVEKAVDYVKEHR